MLLWANKIRPNHHFVCTHTFKSTRKYPWLYRDFLVYLSPDFVIWLDCNLNRNTLGRRLIRFKCTFKQAYHFKLILQRRSRPEIDKNDENSISKNFLIVDRFCNNLLNVANGPADADVLLQFTSSLQVVAGQVNTRNNTEWNSSLDNSIKYQIDKRITFRTIFCRNFTFCD